MSFDEQSKLRKILVEPAEEGEETDYESDQEGISAETGKQASYDQKQDR